jgi:hypothetical protein
VLRRNNEQKMTDVSGNTVLFGFWSIWTILVSVASPVLESVNASPYHRTAWFEQTYVAHSDASWVLIMVVRKVVSIAGEGRTSLQRN